jgi:hypothetical protein
MLLLAAELCQFRIRHAAPPDWAQVMENDVDQPPLNISRLKFA